MFEVPVSDNQLDGEQKNVLKDGKGKVDKIKGEAMDTKCIQSSRV